jgi:hypothetical protein
MPNHVTNILRFDGPRDQIENLFDILASEKQADDPDSQSHLVDFENITPMPKDLDCVCRIIGTYNVDEVRPYLEDRRKNWNFMTDEEFEKKVQDDIDLVKTYASNKKKYGYETWRDWRIDNWGTKWNAYSVDVTDDVITFDTAYSTPLPIIKKLSEMFSEVEITVEYADGDIGYNCGRYVFENGEMTEDWNPHGEKATTFALEIKGMDVDEYYESQKEED